MQDAIKELEGLSDRPLEQRAYQPWNSEEDERLRREHADGVTVSQMAESHKRNNGAIRSRLNKLGLTTDL